LCLYAGQQVCERYSYAENDSVEVEN